MMTPRGTPLPHSITLYPVLVVAHLVQVKLDRNSLDCPSDGLVKVPFAPHCSAGWTDRVTTLVAI